MFSDFRGKLLLHLLLTSVNKLSLTITVIVTFDYVMPLPKYCTALTLNA